MKTLFVVNRRSGVRRRRDPASIIRQHCTWEFEIAECEEKTALDSVVAIAIQQNYDAIFAVGGDGTVHEVAKRLIGTPLALGIIPAGSGNGLARHLGISMDWAEALRAAHRVATIDTARVNGLPFIGTMGVGFDAWIADAFASSRMRGLATYLHIGLGGFLRYQRQRYQIDIGGKTIDRQALLVAVANATQYGNNARIAPTASVQDGLLDLVVVERASLFAVPRLFNGTLHRARGIMMRQAPHIVMRRPAAGPAHLDGEPITLPEVLTIDVVPQSLRVLLPESVRTI